MANMTDAQAATQIQQLEEYKRQLRKWEKNISAREQVLNMESQIAAPSTPQLTSNLKQNLPDFLNPVNVGAFGAVMWPFWEQVNFDFGTDPTVSTATSQTQSFQVTQEAALMMMAISVDCYSEDTAGRGGPWQATMRDRQSSRQFNDFPIPLQMMGNRSHPTVLPTPMLLMPNAFFDVVMTSFQTGSQDLTGIARFQFSFFGYRVRVEDAENVLSTVFG